MTEAAVISSLCQRFGCLPSQLLAEDVGILRTVQLANLAQEAQRESE